MKGQWNYETATRHARLAVVALATLPGLVRADDVAAEIRQLKQEVKKLEPLKERLKQLVVCVN